MTAALIIPGLYLGSYRDSLNCRFITAAGISHILNVNNSCRFPDDQSIKFFHLSMSDTGESDLNQIFSKAFPFIDQARDGGGTLLLHCSMGHNRSATVSIGYLMHHLGWTLEKAHEHVRSQSPHIAPHELYLRQLQQFELKLSGKITLTEGAKGVSAQGIIKRLTNKI